MKYNILFIMLHSTTFYHLASSYEELWEKFCMGSTTDEFPILHGLKFETDPVSLFALATRKQSLKSAANSIESGLNKVPN